MDALSTLIRQYGIPIHARPYWDALHDAIGPSTPCAGPDRDRWTGGKRDQAWAADRCLDCPAMIACLEYAQTAGERTGVWGGTTPDDPRRQARPHLAAKVGHRTMGLLG